jgi:hypothetical protein
MISLPFDTGQRTLISLCSYSGHAIQNPDADAVKSIIVKSLPCLFVLALLPTAASAAGLAEDMVALDRAYIPALAITNRPSSLTTPIAP